MDVQVVISPYCLGEDGLALLPNKAMLPNGPLMVATLLRGKGCRLQVIDLVFRKNWPEYLPASSPDVVLFSCHTARNIPTCAAVLNQMRRNWKGKRAYVVVGGNICLDFGVNELSMLGLEVDAAVRGWGHPADVVDQILSKVKGDIWPQEFSEIPLPAVDLLPDDVLSSYLIASDGKYPLYAFGTGCLYYRSCGETYCKADMDSPWRPRLFSDVLAEVKLACGLGYSRLWCVDNIIDFGRAPDFDKAVASRGMEWSGMARPESVCKLTPDYFLQFKALSELAMGVETVSEPLLRVLKRGAKADYRKTIVDAFGKIHCSSKVVSNAFVMLDLPGSTEADFWYMYELLQEARPDTISWSFYNPPASAVLNGRHRLEEMGFYRWPLGYSQSAPEHIVQQAMMLSGRWWKPFWTPDLSCPYFEEGAWFGVNFLEGRIAQEKSARDAAGDIWHSWQKGRRK